MGYVYVLEFPNGKRYVGQTIQNPIDRWYGNYNGMVGEAISYFGKKNIMRYYFAVPNELLDDTERSVIQWLRTTDPEYGYNIFNGGKKGFKQTDETNRINSEKHKGRKQSEETKKKRADSLRGRKRPPRSEEWCRKISEAKKGKKLPPRSEEYLRKQSESQKLAWAKKKGLA